jgi:hypothetical protein
MGLFVWMGTETGADGGGILQMFGIKHLWYQKFAIPSATTEGNIHFLHWQGGGKNFVQ